MFKFLNKNDSNLYYNKQIKSKKNKGYDILKNKETKNMKWMIKNIKPKIYEKF